MQIVRWSSGSTTVEIRLYGDVSPARLEAEQAIARHRADQLGYVPLKKRGWVNVERGDEYAGL